MEIKIGIGADPYDYGFVSWVVTNGDNECIGEGSIRRRGSDRRKPWEWAALAQRHVRVRGHRVMWSRSSSDKLGADDAGGDAPGAMVRVPIVLLRGRR